jgi:hypothetical protein
MKPIFALVASVLALFIPVSGHAYQVTQSFNQPEARDAYGRITVEASVIHVLACNGLGENFGQFYIYQYVNRPGFRAIRPPDWGHAIGGQDFQGFAQAAAVACGQAPAMVPAPAPAPMPSGNWSVWLNRDDPGASADYEWLSFPNDSVPCAQPMAVECRVRGDQRDWRQTGQRYKCAIEGNQGGGVCMNSENPSGCLDYEVRFLCPAR